MPKLFKDYYAGRLLRFLEHDGKDHVDTDDLGAFFEDPTRH